MSDGLGDDQMFTFDAPVHGTFDAPVHGAFDAPVHGSFDAVPVLDVPCTGASNVPEASFPCRGAPETCAHTICDCGSA